MSHTHTHTKAGKFATNYVKVFLHLICSIVCVSRHNTELLNLHLVASSRWATNELTGQWEKRREARRQHARGSVSTNTILHAPSLISGFRLKSRTSRRESKRFDLLHVTPALRGMYMCRGYSHSGSPLCISYSSHYCVFVFCAAGIASDTLNQLPPPTPAIHPHTHM